MKLGVIKAFRAFARALLAAAVAGLVFAAMEPSALAVTSSRPCPGAKPAATAKRAPRAKDKRAKHTKSVKPAKTRTAKPKPAVRSA